MQSSGRIPFHALAAVTILALLAAAPLAQSADTASNERSGPATSLVLRLVDVAGAARNDPRNERAESPDRRAIWLKPGVVLDNSGIADAVVEDKFHVRVWLTPDGQQRLGEAFRANIGGRIAVLLG